MKIGYMSILKARNSYEGVLRQVKTVPQTLRIIFCFRTVVRVKFDLLEKFLAGTLVWLSVENCNVLVVTKIAKRNLLNRLFS